MVFGCRFSVVGGANVAVSPGGVRVWPTSDIRSVASRAGWSAGRARRPTRMQPGAERHRASGGAESREGPRRAR